MNSEVREYIRALTKLCTVFNQERSYTKMIKNLNRKRGSEIQLHSSGVRPAFVGASSFARCGWGSSFQICCIPQTANSGGYIKSVCMLLVTDKPRASRSFPRWSRSELYCKEVFRLIRRWSFYCTTGTYRVAVNNEPCRVISCIPTLAPKENKRFSLKDGNGLGLSTARCDDGWWHHRPQGLMSNSFILWHHSPSC